MKMYVSCPICGRRLCKAENGSDVDIICSHCGKVIRIQVSANEVRAIPAERYTNESDIQKTADGKTAQRFSL